MFLTYPTSPALNAHAPAFEKSAAAGARWSIQNRNLPSMAMALSVMVSGPSVASSSVMTGKLDDERITVEPLNVYAGVR